MGRLLLILLIVLAIVLLWKAFGPGARKSGNNRPFRLNKPAQPQKKFIAPDDDPDFIWKLKKAEYDRKRREEQQRRERQERQRRQQRDDDAGDASS